MSAAVPIATRSNGVPAFDVVLLGASAGGAQALGRVLAGLPEDFPAPLVVLQHRPATERVDCLPAALDRRTALPVRSAGEQLSLDAGTVTVLPPVTSAAVDGNGRLDVVPAVFGTGVDALFAAAAASFGARTLAVVLTGRLSDGASGVRAVRRAGGRVLVQDPSTAVATGMPTAALATGCVDHMLPLDLIAAALVALVMAPGAADLLAVPLPAWARLSPAPPAGGIPHLSA